MKVIAMYLPQFHEVEENNEWWGKGFTEWTTVKNAKSLYESHQQPIKPYNEYYYNLLEKKTMEWQAALMKQYGVDGVCIYHYWFKGGRKILEKPAENLLKWKDIDIPFCFSWANETWARTWSKEKNKNSWTSIYEKEENAQKSGVLLEQKYGNEKDWKTHFEYLSPFFKDNRYLKIDGKPILVFYRVSLISCFENMVDYWQELARKEGMPGLFIIGNSCKDKNGNSLDGELIHNPGGILKNCDISVEKVRIADYDKVWKEILLEKQSKNKFIGGFVSYDDTPRHGRNGMVIQGANPEKFKKYFSELLAKNEAEGNDITFLNAWNEWGEGMYLEPDTMYGCEYLSALLYAKHNYKKYISKYKNFNEIGLNSSREKFNKLFFECERERHLQRIFDGWMELKNRNINIAGLLGDEIKEIAIYGYGLFGKHFYEEVKKSNLSVKYIIDRNKQVHGFKEVLLSPHDDLPHVDIVVITATYSYGEIYKLLKNKGINNIISLEHLIMENV